MRNWRLRVWAGAALLGLMVQSNAASAQAAPAAAISASDKAQGAAEHPKLVQQFGGAYQGPQADYVRRVGQRIAVQSGLSNAQGDFTVTLLNSNVNNAFAIPGGYVYVTRELLALMNDEAELASVMGHEVGHVAARHAKSRENTTNIAGIGTGLLGAVLGNSALAQLVTKGVGIGAQLGVLGFSRGQEYQADDLGVSYLAKAGYDPMASSTMLASLAAQSSLDDQIAGRNGRVPDLVSTHPNPGSRVARAAQKAAATGVTRGLRNRDAFLNVIDGMIYGDDPAQGVVDGQTFRHPGLRVAFTAPTGFAVSNAPDAVTMSGQGGQAQFKGAAYSGDLDAYVGGVFRTLAGNSTIDVGAVRRFQINGVDAASATARANTQSGPVDVTVVAYAFDPKTAFHLELITAQGSGIGPFDPLVQSMRRLSATEAAAIKPRRLKVVAVRSGDSVASLSARMAYTTMQEQRFRVLNALGASDAVRPGQRVKLIVWG